MSPPRFLYYYNTNSSSPSYDVRGGGNVTTYCNPFLDCLPPYLPSPPLPVIPSDPDSINLNIKHPNRLLPNFLIAAASLLAFSFFLLLLFYFLLRHRRLRRHAISPLTGHHHLQDPNPNLNPTDPFEDPFDGTHHVWLIRTVGLDEAAIKAIGSKVYKAADGLIDVGDCSVCLGEFADGEIIKILPKCKHGFHVECVDTWLKAHVNCPLCRSAVLEEVDAKLDDLETGQADVLVDSAIAIDEPSSSRRNEDEDEDEVQPMRRSVSMDASALGMLMIRVDMEAESKPRNGKKEIELGNANANKNDVVEMKRSMSSRSGRLFFPRYGRGRSASVLPL